MFDFCITVCKSLAKDRAYSSRSCPHFPHPEPDTRFKTITLVQQCNHDTCEEMCFYTISFYFKKLAGTESFVQISDKYAKITFFSSTLKGAKKSRAAQTFCIGLHSAGEISFNQTNIDWTCSSCEYMQYRAKQEDELSQKSPVFKTFRRRTQSSLHYWAVSGCYC